MGKLQIDEKRVKDAPPIKNKEDAHSRAMAIIRSRNKDAPEEPVTKPEPKKWQPVQKKTETPEEKVSISIRCYNTTVLLIDTIHLF